MSYIMSATNLIILSCWGKRATVTMSCCQKLGIELGIELGICANDVSRQDNLITSQ